MKIDREKLKIALKKKGLTRYGLAVKMGIYPCRIYEWVRGKGISAKSLCSMSEILCVPIEELTNGEEVKIPDKYKIERMEKEIEELKERIAIMTEGKEVKYTPEKGKLYDEEYWLCGCCNEPIEIGTVERKHLRNYCYLCGAKVDKGEENED